MPCTACTSSSKFCKIMLDLGKKSVKDTKALTASKNGNPKQLHTIRYLCASGGKFGKSIFTLPEHFTLLQSETKGCLQKNSTTADLVPPKVPSSRYHTWKDIYIKGYTSNGIKGKSKGPKDHPAGHPYYIEKTKGPSEDCSKIVLLDGYW